MPLAANALTVSITGGNMRRLLYPLALFSACTLVVILAWQRHTDRARAEELYVLAKKPHSGFTVPSMHARLLNGDSIIIADEHQGRRQLIFAFLTTCHFCEQSTPAWNRISRELSKDSAHVDVIALSLEPDSVLRPFLATRDLAYKVARFPDLRTVKLYRAGVVPLTAVIESDGTMSYARNGAVINGSTIDSILTAVRREPASARPTVVANIR